MTSGRRACGVSQPEPLDVLDTGQPSHQVPQDFAVNPASLPPDDDPEKPLQDGLEAIDTVKGRPDLKDDPLLSSDEVLFTDGSSYVQEEIRLSTRTAGSQIHILDQEGKAKY
ncbi:uncharacterized protein WM277_007509 isoform 2-T3 [Molossus nigricans]